MVRWSSLCNTTVLVGVVNKRLVSYSSNLNSNWFLNFIQIRVIAKINFNYIYRNMANSN